MLRFNLTGIRINLTTGEDQLVLQLKALAKDGSEKELIQSFNWDNLSTLPETMHFLGVQIKDMILKGHVCGESLKQEVPQEIPQPPQKAPRRKAKKK